MDTLLKFKQRLSKTTICIAIAILIAVAAVVAFGANGVKINLTAASVIALFLAL
jgi:hypothetical protein